MKSALIALSVFMSFINNTYADCVLMPDKQVTVNIEKSYSPVFDGRGEQHSGCILQGNGDVLGYTRDESLCSITANEKVTLNLSNGCCDTGPDDGDLECTVRSKGSWWLNTVSIHGNGTLVKLAK